MGTGPREYWVVGRRGSVAEHSPHVSAQSTGGIFIFQASGAGRLWIGPRERGEHASCAPQENPR